jgi:thioredoxin 1
MALEQWNDEQLTSAIGKGGALLIDLQADWCPQCGPQEQILERVAPEFEGKVTFASMDVALYPSILDSYGVMGLPTLLLFNAGEYKESMNGFKRAPLVRMALEKLVNS